MTDEPVLPEKPVHARIAALEEERRDRLIAFIEALENARTITSDEAEKALAAGLKPDGSPRHPQIAVRGMEGMLPDRDAVLKALKHFHGRNRH